MSKFYERSKLESSDVQGPAIEYAKKRGWFIEAIQSKSRNGFPDTFCARKGRILLCEFKKPGKEPTEQQRLRHEQLRAQSVEVVWFDNLDDAKAFFH